MGFIYRSARYDCLGVLLLSVVFLSYSIRPNHLRFCAIAFLGLLLPLAGIQLILYSGILCLLMLALQRMRIFWESVALGAGMMMGLGVLLGLFYEHGVLENFRSALFGERTNRFHHLFEDPSFAILLATCIFLAIDQVRRHEFQLVSPLGVGIACGLVIPIGMVTLGKYPIYYSWMAFIPLSIAVTAHMSGPAFAYSRLPGIATASGLGLVCLTGLPVQIASALYYWNDRDCGQIESLYQKALRSDDCVYTQYSGYFAARKITTHVFGPFTIPNRYHNEISIMIISPRDYEQFAQAIIGGDWQDTGEGIADTGHDLIPNNYGGILLQRRVNLEVYRRVGSMAKDASAIAMDLPQPATPSLGQ